MHIKEEERGYYMEKIRKNGPLISVHHPKLAMVSMLLGNRVYVSDWNRLAVVELD